ncbi:MAG: hypothetical protein VXV96_05010 [Bdellovibrionota bacterium]|nr:hypothetical protein [Bdellovibrionota bacterium]
MKKAIIVFFLMSFSSVACQEGTVIENVIDIPSEKTCEQLMKAAAQKSCNPKLDQEVDFFLPKLEVTEIYAGEYCFLKMKSGLMKVMTDWMAEPPVATVIYSIWD